MKKYLFILLFLLNLIAAAGEFDLFEEGVQMNPSVFNDFKYNKFKTSYSLYPVDQKKFGLSYSRFLSNKLGFLVEYDHTESGSTFKEKAEILFGGTYRFTKRAWTWVFLGDIGISVNDDVKNLNDVPQGFRANHLFLRFSAEYIFQNGFGFDYSMVGRMTFETSVDEEIFPIHSIGLIYQF